MKRKILASMLAAVLATSVVMSGCGNKGDNKKEDNKKDDKKTEAKENSDNTKQEKMDKEQYYNVILGAEPKTLDPSKATDTLYAELATNTMEALTRLEEDENGKLVVSPGVATEWKQSEDGLKWTFKLRDSNWSDGKPVTVDDFIYSFSRTLNPKTGSKYAQILYPIKNAEEFNKGKAKEEELGLKKVDEHTLEIELKSPCPYFLDLTYFNVLVPQRKDIVEKSGEKFGSEKDTLIFNGPFVISEWKHESEIDLQKNPEYWDKDAVKLDKVSMRVIKETNSVMNEMVNGNIDACGVRKPEWIERFDKTGEYNVKHDYNGSSWYMIYNQNNKYFKNAKIRKAFTLALDREGMCKTLDKGLAEPAVAYCPPRVNIGKDEFRESVKKDYIEEIKKENGGKTAKELLIEGLKEINEDPDPTKHTVTLLQQEGGAEAKEHGDYVQNNLKKDLGINLKIDSQQFAIVQKRQETMDFEMLSAGWKGDYNDPNTFFEIFESSSALQPTGWKNEEYDKLIKKASNTIDQKERLKLFEEAEEILLTKDAVISPIKYTQTNTYIRKYVKKYSNPTWSQRDFKYTYISGREK